MDNNKRVENNMKCCPFCGTHKVKITTMTRADVEYYQGLCNRCYARGPKTRDKLEAVRLWNNRDYSTIPKVSHLKIDEDQFKRFLDGEVCIHCDNYDSYIALLNKCIKYIPNIGSIEKWGYTWNKYKENTVAHAKSSIVDKHKLWFGFSNYDYYINEEHLSVETIIIREVYTDEE